MASCPSVAQITCLDGLKEVRILLHTPDSRAEMLIRFERGRNCRVVVRVRVVYLSSRSDGYGGAGEGSIERRCGEEQRGSHEAIGCTQTAAVWSARSKSMSHRGRLCSVSTCSSYRAPLSTSQYSYSAVLLSPLVHILTSWHQE